MGSSWPLQVFLAYVLDDLLEFPPNSACRFIKLFGHLSTQKTTWDAGQGEKDWDQMQNQTIQDHFCWNILIHWDVSKQVLHFDHSHMTSSAVGRAVGSFWRHRSITATWTANPIDELWIWFPYSSIGTQCRVYYPSCLYTHIFLCTYTTLLTYTL